MSVVDFSNPTYIWEVAVDFYHYYHHITNQALQIELRQRHVHARLLADARASGARPSRLRIDRFLSALNRRPAIHGAADGGLARIPAPLAAAAIAVPTAGLDTDVLPADAIVADRPAVNVLELTASACRLPDGSPGRIAIERLSGEEWVAICVEASLATHAAGSTA